MNQTQVDFASPVPDDRFAAPLQMRPASPAPQLLRPDELLAVAGGPVVQNNDQ